MMKPLHCFATVCLALAMALGFSQRAKACLDTIPRIRTVTCHYDADNFAHYVVRISNLRTANSPFGTFCTCAIHNNHPVLDHIQYVALVDSGTNHRVDGFAQWYHSQAADLGWDSIYHIGWQGFLSQIEGAGIIPNAPVELIIRGGTLGYSMPYFSNDMRPTILGWDNWNDNTQLPAVVHQRWLDLPGDSNFVFIPINAPSTFFADFDADLIYTGLDPQADFSTLTLYPNPVRDVLTVALLDPNIALRQLNIYDGQGRPVMLGIHAATRPLSIDVAALSAGVYFARFQTSKGWVTKRFMKGE